MFSTEVWLSDMEVIWLLNNSALIGAVQASDRCGDREAVTSSVSQSLHHLQKRLSKDVSCRKWIFSL